MSKAQKQTGLLSVKDLMKHLNVSETSARRLIREGKVPGAKRVQASTPTGYKYVIPASQFMPTHKVSPIKPSSESPAVVAGSKKVVADLIEQLYLDAQRARSIATQCRSQSLSSGEKDMLYKELELRLYFIENFAKQITDSEKV